MLTLLLKNNHLGEIMKKIINSLAILGSLTLASASATADCTDLNNAISGGDPLHTKLSNAISPTPPLAGLGFQMWATVVDSNGIVCAVANTDNTSNNAQWLGSRVISAQKANTANAFSITEGLALSTANLWAATQPGGSLFGLQFSNPVNPAIAYGANPALYGTVTDPLVEQFIGGVNVFGGGLALYADDGTLLGAIGMSGDTSCADHIKAWVARDNLGLDYVPAGVANGTDNIIFDITGSHNNFSSKSGFGHPTCGFGEESIAEALPTNYPLSPIVP